jgi:hypothetical protein
MKQLMVLAGGQAAEIESSFRGLARFRLLSMLTEIL